MGPDKTTDCSVCERKGRGGKREGREEKGDGGNGRMEGWTMEIEWRMGNGEESKKKEQTSTTRNKEQRDKKR